MVPHPPLADIRQLLDERELFKLKDALKGFQPSELAELIEGEEADTDRQAIIFRVLPLHLATQTFELLDLSTQRHFLETLSSDKMVEVLNEMAPDDRTELLEFLPSDLVRELILQLSEPERRVTLELLGYPEYSVGRLMTPDYIAVRQDWTVEHVLDYVREHGRRAETLNVLYVTDERGVLLDDLRIHEVLLAPRTAHVRDLMDRRYISLQVMQDQEEALELFEKHDRVALPVLNPQGVLFGIVTVDDMLDVRAEEDTEDIQKLGGSQALEEPYLDTPLLTMVRKRVGWLIVLFLGELLTATAMSHFEGEIAKAVVLATFIPLIISSGGNAGSQATSLIIRGMALGEFSPRDWMVVLRREVVSGLLLGLTLAVLGFLRIGIWEVISPATYGPHWAAIGFAVGFSVLGVVLWGTLAGSMLPLLLRRLGLDPATASAPFVATLVDVTGLVIYFSFALLFLRGTLL
ncbi:MAG: magnesium transporter [Hymenobacteraceae bacterium]|nr:magnesium transporter [Hymenobacteraceae bacterium]